MKIRFLASPRYAIVAVASIATPFIAKAQEDPLIPKAKVPVVEEAPALPQPTTTNVYKNDLTEQIELTRWSHTGTLRTPNGKRLLKLDMHTDFHMYGLPEHEFVRVRMKLVTIGTFDGSDAEFGPDRLTVVPRGGTTLLRSTFGNLQLHHGDPDPRLAQAFPDDEIIAKAALHPAATGASKPKMAYGYPNSAAYDIELVFPHRDKFLKLDFQYQNNVGDGAETYALGSFEVDIVSGPVRYTEAQLAAAWTALTGADPARANRAVFEFIACGEAGAEYLRKKDDTAGDGGAVGKDRKAELIAKIKAGVKRLSSENFQDRVSARIELKKLPPESLPLLEAELKAAGSAEVRVALKGIVKVMKARQQGELDARSAQERLVRSRISKVLRVWDIAASGRIIKSSSGTFPKGSLDDGYWPTGKLSGYELPRFRFTVSGDPPHDEWVEYSFPKERSFDFTEVMWVEQKNRNGGVKLPESWSIVYLDGEEWKPVELKGGGKYGVTAGKLDRVEFKSVKTKSIRLLVTERKNSFASIYEWRVGEGGK